MPEHGLRTHFLKKDTKLINNDLKTGQDSAKMMIENGILPPYGISGQPAGRGRCRCLM